MPTLETLTLNDLKQNFRSGSLNKARGHLNRVRNATRTGQTLTAEIAGQRYQVEAELTPTGIVTRCSYPYDWNGYCEHVAAMLLKWLESPDTFIVKEAAPVVSGSIVPVIPVEPLPTQKPKERPFWLGETVADRQQGSLTRLEQALEQLKVQELREMAKKRGWTIRGTGKADLARQISAYMTRPAEIENAIRSLDEEHRQILRALVLLSTDEGLRLAEMQPVATLWGKLKNHKQITTYTRHLSEAGLALPTSVAGIYGQEADIVPRAIARQLPPPLAEVIPSHPSRPPDPEADELRLADPLALVRLANQITLLLEQSSPPLRTPLPRPRFEKFYPSLADWDYDPVEILELSQRKNFQPYAQDITLAIPPPAWSLPDEVIARLAPLAGDEARLEFIFDLLVAAGLFQPGSPVTIWPEIKEQYLRQTEASQRAILSRTYFLMLNWSELWDVLRANTKLQLRRTGTYPYFKPLNLSIELTRLRHMALRVLACLPDGEWVALNDLRPLLRAFWPRFDGNVLQPAYGYGMKPTWFLTHQGHDLKPGDESDWQVAQWPFLRYLIAGPLHWLGLADLSLKNGVLVAVRFHGLADLYWDRVETPALSDVAATSVPDAPPAEAVTTAENSIIVDPAAISAQAHNLLDQIARLDQAVPGRFVYSLDPQAAHQAFEKGVALADIFDNWAKFLATPLPETIRSRLESWWQAYGQVRIYEDVTLIEFGDDYALTEMKAVTSLERQLIAELSPRLVLIPKAAVEPLTVELEKAGYTPKLTDDVR